MVIDSGLVQVPSNYSVDETIERMTAAFAEKGMQVFAVIDHSGAAEKVGLKMRLGGAVQAMIAEPGRSFGTPFVPAK